MNDCDQNLNIFIISAGEVHTVPSNMMLMGGERRDREIKDIIRFPIVLGGF